MAFYIAITKIEENDFFAKYRFEGDGGKVGSFQIDKKSGEVSLTERMLGDEKSNVFNRAAVKIIREWKKGNLPMFTEWAS